MRFNFNKVKIHNFLSYGDAEIDLTNRNYCLVKGINKCPLDNAVSNGSGKSSWISSICWCLTGETVQGITNGIKNIYIDENSCYVTVDLDVDGDNYVITRIKEPSPNLKIIKNGEDISGKGIRESQLILSQYLPDLNRKLLCSVILLGQGLPIRFTDNTPSGRKGVLEELSKSVYFLWLGYLSIFSGRISQIATSSASAISSHAGTCAPLIPPQPTKPTFNIKSPLFLNIICVYIKYISIFGYVNNIFLNG